MASKRERETQKKSAEVLERVLSLVNETDNVFGFEADMGGNSLTVYCGNFHSHVGCDGNDFHQLIDSLHGLLCRGHGLSWAEGQKAATP